MEHWYLFHAKPHKERQAAEQLGPRCLEVFLPLVQVNPVNPRAARERPYFPGYLFAKVDLQVVGPGLLQWLPGVRRLVEFGGEPASLPESFIYDLKRRVAQIRAAGGVVFDTLRPGDPVKITSGPFAGYEAIFDSRLRGTERVRVLLEWIERVRHPARPAHFARAASPRSIPVELNVRNIEKINAGRGPWLKREPGRP